ncbi:Transcriptional activator of glycolytic enzyme [Phytophthora infestans]|uniref:Transcriptional activator of glycolytic enzyme n=1 Tax=Phytophthora infestans TaxID=4787 RepID=A0A8S9UKZ5_PHYIN|nr:Transcriptional activator of glycolytic enzyme [Phytophthora infestans]
MENPAEQRLQKAIPVLNTKIDGIHQDFKTTIGHLESTLNGVKSSLADITHLLAPLQNGTAVLQVEIVSHTQTNGIPPQPFHPPPTSGSSATTDPSSVRRYKMRQGLVTIDELWNEWAVGIDGLTPVRELEAKYGTKWCDSDERRFFNRRRPISSLVEDVAASVKKKLKIPYADAVNLSIASVELYRRSNSKSRNWIAKNTSTVAENAKASATKQPTKQVGGLTSQT